MRINPVITALGLLGLFAASMLVGYVGGQAFLSPAKSAPQPSRASTPTPVAEPPAQPAPPLGATRQPTISSAPTPPAPTQSAPTSSPSAPVTPSKPAPSAAQSQPAVNFRVQAGAFRRKENADARMAQLKQDGYEPYIITSGDLFRVIVGAFTDRENAIRLQEELHARGYDVLVLTVR